MFMTFLCISKSHYTREVQYVGEHKATAAFIARYKEYSILTKDKTFTFHIKIFTGI